MNEKLANVARQIAALIMGFVGIMLYGLGAAYIGAPSFGTYWIRSLIAIIFGIALVVIGIRLGLKRK